MFVRIKHILKIFLELGVLLWYQLGLLYSLPKKIGVGPPGAPSSYFFLTNQKCMVNHVILLANTTKLIYIDIYIGTNTFISLQSHDNYHGYL